MDASTHSHILLRLVVDLFLWLQTQDIAIRARHILGCLNVIAIHLSRPNQPNNNNVESPPRNSEADIRDVGNSSSGHVCHSPQLASSPFYVSSSGASRTGDRCSVTRLAGKVDVHVFTVPTAKQNHSEAQDHSEGRGDTHSPHGCHNLGSTLTTSVCRPPMLLSVPPRPTVTTGICLERQVVPSACMGALIQHYQAAGFSREVSRLAAAPRRLSTNKMYNNS